PAYGGTRAIVLLPTSVIAGRGTDLDELGAGDNIPSVLPTRRPRSLPPAPGTPAAGNSTGAHAAGNSTGAHTAGWANSAGDTTGGFDLGSRSGAHSAGGPSTGPVNTGPVNTGTLNTGPL